MIVMGCSLKRHHIFWSVTKTKTLSSRRIRLTSTNIRSGFLKELEHIARNCVVTGYIIERIRDHGQVVADEPGSKPLFLQNSAFPQEISLPVYSMSRRSPVSS